MQISKNLPAIQTIIDKLEAKRYHVRLSHDSKNTRTTIMVIEKGHRYVTKQQFTGVARCVREDQFCRATGTRIAFNRAIHSMTKALGRKTVKELLA